MSDASADPLAAEILELERRWTQALADGDIERVRSFMTADQSA